MSEVVIDQAYAEMTAIVWQIGNKNYAGFKK